MRWRPRTRRGIVHRDLKPANIKITPDGSVKVLDFGLAKAVARDGVHDPAQSLSGAASDTHEGVILGTSAYMSPEQARGQTVDKRTDIWAFGCVLYEMLTGRAVVPGETPSDHIAAILEGDPDWTALPVTTPPSIRRLLRRCLEKESARRLPDIAVARLEIDDAAGVPGGAAEAAATVTSRSRDRAWRNVAAAAVVIALATIGFAAWSAMRPSPMAAPITFTLPPPEGLRYLSIYGSLSLSPDGRTVAFRGDRREPGGLRMPKPARAPCTFGRSARRRREGFPEPTAPRTRSGLRTADSSGSSPAGT